MTVIALFFSIIVSTGSLAWALAGVGFARWILIFGAVWLFTQWRGWGWFSSLGLCVAVFASGIGMWLGFSIEWFVSSTIFALFAWDVTDFRQQMRSIARDDNLRAMERRHIGRNSLFSFLGLSLVSVVLLMRGQFSFEWGVLLVVMTLFGVGQLFNWLKR